ncbi:hypothetical protein GW17_00049053, partial [Ensete ventricosum]
MFRTFFTLAGAGSHIHMPGMVNSAYSLNDFPSAQSLLVPVLAAKQILVMKQSIKSCLYKLTFAYRCPGFLKLKMQNKNGVPVAFVDFQ